MGESAVRMRTEGRKSRRDILSSSREQRLLPPPFLLTLRIAAKKESL